MGTTTLALTSFEVAVGRRGAALTDGQLVGIHAQAHRAARATPFGARVDAAAIVINSIVGDEVIVAAGARVVDSVLLPGAHVGLAATVESSLVMGRVGEGARVENSMVGADGVVSDGAVLSAGALPEPEAS